MTGASELKQQVRKLATLVALASVLTSCVATPAPARSGPAPAAGARSAARWPPIDVDWAHDAVGYEIFVRSFSDSDGDGVGDLRGVIERLDLLNDGDPATSDDLGVDLLWLMPTFSSPSYHGYDVVDFDTVNPQYGTRQTLQQLVAAAHRRGMRVLLDLPLNHTSDRHPWFVDAATSPTSHHRDWYLWRSDDPGWGQPWNAGARSWHRAGSGYYYGLFWGGMPDLNWSNGEVRSAIADSMLRWLDLGVDGFRLDAVRHLVESGPGSGQSDASATHRHLRELAARLAVRRSDVLLIGEIWADAATIAPYYGAAGEPELGATYDFPLASAIVDGVRDRQAQPLADALQTIIQCYPVGAVDITFVDNHDQVRLASQLGDDDAGLRQAAALLLTLPGTPFIYYGDEIGQRNGPTGDDEDKRRPLAWANVASQRADPTSLLSLYRQLIRLRQRWQPLRRGTTEVLVGMPHGDAVLALQRRAGEQRLLVLHNLTDQPAEAGPFLIEATAVRPLWTSAPSAEPMAVLGAIGVLLPPRASGVWLIE